MAVEFDDAADTLADGIGALPFSLGDASADAMGRFCTSAELFEAAARDFLATVDSANPPGPGVFETKIVERTRSLFGLQNAYRTAGYGPKDKIPAGTTLVVPQAMHPVQVAEVVKHLHPLARILLSGTDPDKALLGIYQTDGADEGLYVRDDSSLYATIARYSPSISVKGINEVIAILRRGAPLRDVSRGPKFKQYSVVANGVFDWNQQELLPFSPAWVFLSKSPVPYDKDAPNPIIDTPHGDQWDPESWIASLSDDEGVPELLWEIIAASQRPNWDWGKSPSLLGDDGSNGKGTFTSLLCSLNGEKATATLSIKDFGKDFMLEPVINASLIVSDENPVGTFVDDTANFKAMVTHDAVLVNRKNKVPVMVRFWGLIVPNLNERRLHVKDKSESFLRRQLPIPFNKRFIGDGDRSYIKHDYLKRDGVLRYILKRALQMRHEQLSMPKACEELLDEQRVGNDLRVEFVREIEPILVWNMVPSLFLYDLWTEFKLRRDPDGRPGSQRSLTEFLQRHMAERGWDYVKEKRPSPELLLLSVPEPLIAEYGLTRWMNEYYSGTDPRKKAVPTLKQAKYAAFVRRVLKPDPHAAGAASHED